MVAVNAAMLKRGRKKRRFDVEPGRTAEDMRKELRAFGFRNVSKLTKIEMSLKLQREHRRIALLKMKKQKAEEEEQESSEST